MWIDFEGDLDEERQVDRFLSTYSVTGVYYMNEAKLDSLRRQNTLVIMLMYHDKEEAIDALHAVRYELLNKCALGLVDAESDFGKNISVTYSVDSIPTYLMMEPSDGEFVKYKGSFGNAVEFYEA